MGGRELVILLLGLAIVAVVLRGVYIALQGRRGQIRMAIDKSIPQNIDLESLELAELPGGGARTVDRSLQQVNHQNSAFDTAQIRAEALDLGEVSDNDSHIPVLMDAVELGAPKRDSRVAASSSEAESQDNELTAEEGEDYLAEEDYEADLVAVPPITESTLEDELDEQAAEDDPDSILFDYDEDEEDELAESSFSDSAQAGVTQDIDPLKAVAPDYEQETEENDDRYQDYEEEGESLVEDEEQNSVADGFDEESPDKGHEYAESDDVETEGDEQPVFDPVNSLDDFSMTAGERIGASSQGLEQSGLFDEEDEVPAEAEAVKPKLKSMFSWFERKAKPAKTEDAAQPEPEPEPEIPETVTAVDSVTIEDEEIAEPIDELEQVRATQAPEPVQESSEPSEVIVLNVMARNGRVFAGDDLLHLLITSGLKFGDMNIFHKRLSNDSQGPIIFSVANILNPGTFDLNNMEEFTTLGISLFLALPSPINNLDAFEQMLGVAQQIRGTLDGELKDDHRNGMTAQTIEHYRQRIRDFELLRLKTAGARA